MIDIQNCIFSYLITDDNHFICPFPKVCEFGKYMVFASKKTNVEIFQSEEFDVIIIGFATLVTNIEDCTAIEWLSSNSSCLSDLIKAEYSLGGKYVIFARIKSDYYILGDATGSVPIYYSTDKHNWLTSNIQMAVQEFDYKIDDCLLKVRNMSKSKTMPYNYTKYYQIKKLIPNHYLDVQQKKVVRFVNHALEQEEISSFEVAKITAPMIERLYLYYSRHFKLACPLTGGRDSRVVLALLIKNKQIPVYTIYLDRFTEDTQDVVIPKEIAKVKNLNYTLIKNINNTNDILKNATEYFGEDNYSQIALMLANTINKSFGEYAIVNGDIIGQVGKCSLHRDINKRFATARYFRCKLHNYSAFAIKALNEWLEDINVSSEKVSTFDLFSIENRLGRWAYGEKEVYNAVGQYDLNIFNSRSIIYEWTKVDRASRMNSNIHKELIKLFDESLLDIPFESSSLFEKMAKKNGMMFLFASYLKFYVMKLLFFIKR